MGYVKSAKIVECRNSRNIFSYVEINGPRAIRAAPAIQLREAKLQKLFKQKLAERGLKGRMRSNHSGCLDQCEHGPTVVVYPEAIWYGFVTLNDVEEIIDSHIVGGKPVERLRLADSCLNTESCEHRTAKK